MYRHKTVLSLVRLWMLVCTITTSARAIASQGTIVTATNRTRGESTLKLTSSESLLNNTFTPSQNFISYRVPNSQTTLLIHHFGPTIPVEELLRSIAFAVKICYTHIGEGKGKTPIAGKGLFKYKHEFLNHDEVEITVADFREIGKVMTYFILFDVVSGVGQFMISPGQTAREVDFEVDFEGVGYVGTGHVSYKKVEAPASSVV